MATRAPERRIAGAFGLVLEVVGFALALVSGLGGRDAGRWEIDTSELGD
jgi:hypothetical protein